MARPSMLGASVEAAADRALESMEHGAVAITIGLVGLIATAAGQIPSTFGEEVPPSSMLGVVFRIAGMVGLPLLVVQLTVWLWRAPLRRVRTMPTEVQDAVAAPMERMRGEFTGVVESLFDVTTKTGMSVLVPNALTRTIVTSVCDEVIGRTLDLQRTLPLTANLKVSMTVTRKEPLLRHRERVVVVVHRSEDFELGFSNRDAHLGDVVRPQFVCTSRVFDYPEVLALAEHGLIDLLYPVPFAWYDELLTSEERAEARSGKIEWLRIDRIRVQDELLYDGKSRRVGLVPAYNVQSRQVDEILRSAIALEDVKRPPMDRERRASAVTSRLLDLVTPETCRHLAEVCLQFLWVDNPFLKLQFGDMVAHGVASLAVTVDSVYKVWVQASQGADVLYRYEYPFGRAALVKSIAFSLGDKVSRAWQLDPPAVNGAFTVDHARWDHPKAQVLEWFHTVGTPPISGTPFLPGHGVVFMWRDRVAARPSSPAAMA